MNGLERDIRRLLWNRRGTSAAPSVALTNGIQTAFGTSNVAAALEIAISQALSGYSETRRATFEQVLRGTEFKARSRRSYYRAKKEAVERLAQVVRVRLNDAKVRRHASARVTRPIALPMVDRLTPECIEPERYRGPDRGRALSAAALSAEMSGEQSRADAFIAEAGDNVRDQYDRRHVVSAFEVSQNELFIARCRGDLPAMRAAIRKMTRLCHRLDEPSRAKFALDCSEVYLYEGRVVDASSELDVALLNAASHEGTLLRSIALVRTAQIALARRDIRAAHDAAKAASEVARLHADIRVYAAEVLGRSSLQTGSRWSSNGLEQCQSAFHAISLRSMLARYAVRRNELGTAVAVAERSYRQATQLRYWNLASRSAATLAACAGDGSDGWTWLAEAMRLHLSAKRRNAFEGEDLFEFGEARSRSARAFLQSDCCSALAAELVLRQFPSSSWHASDGSLLRYFCGYLGSSATHGSSPTLEVRTGETDRWVREIGARQEQRELSDLATVVCAFSILLPFVERDAFVKTVRRRAGVAARALRRSLARSHWMALR